jgi:hypothetical protein
MEKLFARHLLVPARASFSTIKDARKSKSAVEVQGLLQTLLEPLRNEMTKPAPNVPEVVPLVRVLPLLLEEAIRLSPRATPRQKSTEVPWLEFVFAALSSCAGEPVSLVLGDISKLESNSKVSPLANMLKAVHEQGISLTSTFLESILVEYSGLLDLPKQHDTRDSSSHGISSEEHERKLQPQWALISVLLTLDGSIFLEKKATEPASHSIKYVDALVTSIAAKNLGTKPRFVGQVASKGESAPRNAYPLEVTWDNSRKTMVTRILIPLMQAYVSTREMGTFLALWFRELRRDWSKLGTTEEESFAWAAPELCQAFWALLEGSMTVSKINDQIVEYSIPIKVLADEVNKVTGPIIDWSMISAIAPASSAFVLLQALLQGIEKEDSLPLETILQVHDLVACFTAFDLSKFRCASRIWSILTRLHELVFCLDSKKAVSECPKAATLHIAASISKTRAELQTKDPQYHAACEAYRFLIVVSSNMLTLPELTAKVKDLGVSSILTDLGTSDNPNAFYQRDVGHESAKIRYLDTVMILVQHPTCLS